MHTEYTVIIASDGSASFFLHHDDHPLFDPEKATIVRASNVRFDNEAKVWNVWECLPNGLEKKLPGDFVLRSKAIAHEIDILEAKVKADPDYLAARFELQVKERKKGALLESAEFMGTVCHLCGEGHYKTSEGIACPNGHKRVGNGITLDDYDEQG